MKNAVVICLLASAALTACGGSGSSSSSSSVDTTTGSQSGGTTPPSTGTTTPPTTGTTTPPSTGTTTPPTTGTTTPPTGGTTTPPTTGTSNGFVAFGDTQPAAGSAGTSAIPSGGGLEDVSKPDHVIGNGTPSSCTSAAVVAAAKAGGIITFNCGSAPITIQMSATAKLFNNGANKTVIDGAGLVTLSGMKQRRILYMNTCDQAMVWTTAHCDNQQYPQLTVQNLTFVDGNASNESAPEGGAIYASGGRLKVVNSRFFTNVCASTGPDTAGAAVYAFEQYQAQPVYVVHSTFGGATDKGNTCSNGGAVGSIGVSWTILNSVMSYNHSVGHGGNPADSGTPGGGSGGAIYNDGNTMTLTINGSTLEYNQVNAFGSGVFFVSNNLTGNIVINDSTIMGNIGGSWYPKYPQISAPDSTPITVKNSTITN